MVYNPVAGYPVRKRILMQGIPDGACHSGIAGKARNLSIGSYPSLGDGSDNGVNPIRCVHFSSSTGIPGLSPVL